MELEHHLFLPHLYAKSLMTMMVVVVMVVMAVVVMTPVKNRALISEGIWRGHLIYLLASCKLMPDSFMKDAYLILKTAPENLKLFLASSLPDLARVPSCYIRLFFSSF